MTENNVILNFDQYYYDMFSLKVNTNWYQAKYS